MDQAAALELDQAEEDYLVASQEFQTEFNTTTAAGDTTMKAAAPHTHTTTAHTTTLLLPTELKKNKEAVKKEEEEEGLPIVKRKRGAWSGGTIVGQEGPNERCVCNHKPCCQMWQTGFGPVAEEVSQPSAGKA